MRRPDRVFLALLIIGLLTFLLPVAVALGQAPPQLPHTFFGEDGAITVNGGPPNRNDLVLTASVQGVDGITRRYSIPIEPDGSFGGPGFLEQKLKVGGDGNEIAEGTNINFLITTGGVDFVATAPGVQFSSSGSRGFQAGDVSAALPEQPTPTPTFTPTPTSPVPVRGDDDDDGDVAATFGDGGNGPAPTNTPVPPQAVTPTPEGEAVVAVTPAPTLGPTATQPPQPPTLTPTPEGTSAVGGAGAPTTPPPTPLEPIAAVPDVPTVEPPPPPEQPPLVQPEGGVPWWVWLLVGVGAASLIGGGFYYLYFMRTPRSTY